MTDRPNRLPETAFDVVRRFRDFDQYGSSDRAIAALRRRTRAGNAAACKVAFRRASELYDAALRIANARQMELWRSHESGAYRPAGIVAQLRAECPGWSQRLYEVALWWVWYWHFLR